MAKAKEETKAPDLGAVDFSDTVETPVKKTKATTVTIQVAESQGVTQFYDTQTKTLFKTGFPVELEESKLSGAVMDRLAAGFLVKL